MGKGTIVKSTTIGGLSFNSVVSREGDATLTHEVSLPAGTAGTLTTRIGDDTGDITVGAGHGLSNGTYDIYWSGGLMYDNADCSVVGDVVTLIGGGSGDVLPAEGTALVVTKQVPITSDFDGDEVQLITVGCAQRCHLDFQDTGAVTLMAVDILADEGWDWTVDQGIANPLTGNAVTDIYASNGSTTAATLYVGVLLDSTPS